MTARLLLALALLALPGTAMADPITIFAAVLSATGSAFVAGVVATVASYSAYILVAANYIYGGMDARRRARNQAGDARRAHNAGLQDRNASVLQADPPWRVVYGKCRTGGDIVAIFTSDKTGLRTDGSSYTKPDGYKHLVVVLAAHEVDDITEMYIDGVAVGTLDASRWATVGEMVKPTTVTQEKLIAAGALYNFAGPVTVLSASDAAGAYNQGGWTGANVTYTVVGGTVTNTSGIAAIFSVTYTTTVGSVRWGKQLGTTTQTVDTYLTGVVPAQWTASDRLRGLAYVVVTLDLEDQRFQGGPPQMAWDVRGRKVYDPRTTTTGWSENPALIVRDYLTASWGFECAAGDIDDSYTIAAANACAATISLTEGATTTTGPTYTCNGALLSSDSRERVLNDLCDSMAGYAVYGARWQVMAGAWTAPVMLLTDADLAGQIEIVQAGVSLDEVFNGVRGGYVPAGAGVTSDFTYANATFVAADGRELWTEVSLPFTNASARCRNMARVMVEANRDSQVIRMPCTLRAWPLQVGDRVTVTSAEYGFSAKAYRVTDWAFGLQTPVMLTLQEDAADIYDLADAAARDPSPNTDLPSPWVVGPVTSLAATSGDANLLIRADGTLNVRVRVTWAPVVSAYVANGAGRVEVRWRSPRARSIGGTVYPGDAADVWHVVTVPGDTVEAYINAAVPGDRIVIAAVVINGLGARSDARFIDHAVTGRAALVPWAQVSGAGRPADNATVGATWGSNLTGQPADTDLLNTHTQGSVLVVNHPGGGNAGFNAATQTGAIKIRLPQSWTDTMLRFFVEVYEYTTNKSFTLEVGGYTNGTSGWLNAYAKMTGSAAAEKTVRFGHDGTKCCIWIGEPGSIWEYPQITVTNFRAGYNAYSAAAWSSGWQVTLDTSLHSGHAITASEVSPLTGASWSQIPAGTGKAADNATVGGTWGSNLTGQPSDSALLNALQTWAQVSGAGRPADNATVNRMTYGSAPSSPVDGDVWVNTAATPHVINLRVGGAWVTGANLSTGALAQLNAAGTAEITAGAVSDSAAVTTAGPTTLSTTYAELTRVSFGPYTYGARVTVGFFGQVEMTLVTGPTVCSSLFYCEDNTTAAGPVSTVGANTSSSDTDRQQVSMTYSYTLAAGTSGFVRIMGKANDSASTQTDTIRNMYIAAVVLKR